MNHLRACMKSLCDSLRDFKENSCVEKVGIDGQGLGSFRSVNDIEIFIIDDCSDAYSKKEIENLRVVRDWI